MSPSESDEFELIDRLEAGLSSKELAEIQAWLQPTDYEVQSSEFHRHLSSKTPGTGLWICETSKYQQWQKSANHGSLWIKGVPGAGKSVTAASIIEDLQNTTDTPVLYFFFRYIISANRRPRSLIRDFLAQLLPHSTRLQAALQPLLGIELENFSDEILWEHLLTCLSSVEKAYCVVDALDEMELLPSDRILDRFNNLATFRPNSVKLLMTSRPKQYLQSSLRDASIVHISLEDDLVGKDISLFISYRLKSLLPNDDQQGFRKSLAAKISERSSGLFLYARLLLDQIVPSLESTQTELEKLVNDLPVGLEEMYNSMLIQQAESLKIDNKIQVFLLELATHASRALRLNELASALASTFPPSMILGVPKFIAKSACAPLLEVLEDETVQRSTIDISEYTSQFPVLDPDQVHRRLSVICLDYLKSGGLRVEKAVVPQKRGDDSASIDLLTSLDNYDKEADKYDYQEAKLRYPFLEYAVGNWAFHASKYNFKDNDFFQSVASFLDPSSLDFRKWMELEWTRGKSSEFQAPTPLHITAFSSLTTYAKRLLEEGNSVDARDSEDRTPLHWACSRGHISMASLLLQNGAFTDAKDCRGVKPIHEAATKNHASIVGILLKAGVDPLTPKTQENVKRRLLCGEVSTKGETAVEYAYLQGHTETIMVMLPFITLETLEEMFCQCCRYGKFEAARAVLDTTSLSPNSTSSGATALYLACYAKSVPIVELLLAKGADVHRTSEWRITNRNACGSRFRQEPVSTCIHAVFEHQKGQNSTNNTACQQIIRLLLDADADIEMKDADGDTPLIDLVAKRESPDIVIVKGLLQAGANVLAIDMDGDSVLHRYLMASPNIQILKLLFEYGARADAVGSGGDTIMHAALKSSYKIATSGDVGDFVKLLLEMGARCDVTNTDGFTAVEVAACTFSCNLETFTLLLEACSDANVLKRCIWKITERDTTDETVKFIRALQARGVSLEDRDDEGRTVLLTRVGDDALFKAFVECGADFKAIDSSGKGVLHHYIPTFHHNVAGESLRGLEELINMGLDPTQFRQVDNQENNLLHVLAKVYAGKDAKRIDDMIVQKLLDYGISPNSKNNQGMTPLHVLLENWDSRSITNAVDKRLDERFHEYSEMPWLKIFQRNQESFDINSQDADGLTIFHLAALRSETRMFYLLEQGADPTILTKKGRNALHLACRARQSNVVGYLCQTNKMIINQRDSYGRTPLHDACTSGQPESVHYLLKAGADITIVDNNKRTPLHACAEFSDEQRIWTLLARQNEASGHLLQDRFRPVHKISHSWEPWYAATGTRGTRRGPKELDNPSIGLTVKALLLAKSDPMALDSFGRTPLDLAIEYGCPEMVRALQFSADLVQKNRKTEPEDRRMETVMALKSQSLSKMGLQESSLQQILENPLTYLPLLTFEDVDWMARNGGNITGVDETKSPLPFRQSLLYIAASNGFTELVESFGFLACVNDDPKIVLTRINELSSDSEYNPEIEYLAPTLHTACGRELPNMEMIEVLVDKCSVDINAHALVKPNPWTKVKESFEGGTALHVLSEAHYFWQLNAIKYLLQKGANADTTNEKGETPLHIACSGTSYADMNCSNRYYGLWRIECVKLLLDAGADPNILDSDGLSCLHKASSSPQIMRILLENGADVTAGKFSPIFSAIQIQCLEILTILLDAGVSPNSIDHSTGSEDFQLNYRVEGKARSALFRASFAKLQNQQAEDPTAMVKLLIERGADVYALLDDKETLVHYVFEHAEYEIVCAFLECAPKIDFNTRDHLGRTVFLAACEWIECLPGYRHRRWYPKKTAAFLRILPFIADPLAPDNEGRNALHLLLDNPDMEEDAIIQFLAHDAAKNLLHQKDGSGFTPLNCALRLLRPAAVEVLLKMGTDLLSPDPTGATALHRIAAQCINVRGSSRRLWFGQDHEPEFYTGVLALWKKFLSLGGSINVRDNAGSPPLFSYISSKQNGDRRAPEGTFCHLDNFPAYFSEEVAKDVDFQAKNENGENALYVIARREKTRGTKPRHDKELYHFFMGKGLDPLEEDGRGRSSLDVAAACEQKGILELFQRSLEGGEPSEVIETTKLERSMFYKGGFLGKNFV
ncbi:hypothetical protein G7Y89_g3236 [Cudoniella acicularis]|uniref:Nephrocystin 3-like N-terminal domain-containing protein n=1 Tax=Cudoniella acicularis TaxID=354080 RepID=A0A8H4W5D0_9HELO|nr:hypothetical protein G7Y89_g3236 [Cudoniella acicularis]